MEDGNEAFRKALECAERWPMIIGNLGIFAQSNLSAQFVSIVELVNNQLNEHSRTIVESNDRLILVANKLGTNQKLAANDYSSATAAAKTIASLFIQDMWWAVDFTGATSATWDKSSTVRFNPASVAEPENWEKCRLKTRDFIAKFGSHEVFRNLSVAVGRERVELLHSIGGLFTSTNSTTKSKANDENIAKLFPKGVPSDSDIVDLAVRINSAMGSEESQSDIARGLTGEPIGNDPKAKRLLARIRMMRNRGLLNL